MPVTRLQSVISYSPRQNVYVQRLPPIYDALNARDAFPCYSPRQNVFVRAALYANRNMDVSVLTFFVNGKKIEEKHTDPEWTLAYYLREKMRLTGTKVACGEGQCGSCTVALARVDHTTRQPKYLAINACLTPLFTVDGCAITTIEGLGSTRDRMHPIQERLAKGHGSQCGFCTPGFVMSFYCVLRNSPKPTAEQIDVALQGNLCRCTGYRPILESFYTFGEGGCGVENWCKKNKNNTCAESPQLTDWRSLVDYDPTQDPIFPPELQIQATNGPKDARLSVLKGPRVTLFCPTSLGQFRSVRKQHPNALLMTSGTLAGLKQRLSVNCEPVWISLNRICELKGFSLESDSLVVQSGLSLSEFSNALQTAERFCAKAAGGILREFKSRIDSIGSLQLRNQASWVGNMASGSPLSDLCIAALAANCQLSVENTSGLTRLIGIDSGFFTSGGVNIQPDEIITAIKIPFSQENEYFRTYKQGMRLGNDSAVVNAAFLVRFSGSKVESARLAFGGMAARPILASKTAAAIEKRDWNESLLETAMFSLGSELRLPQDAPGGRSQYRLSLCLSFFHRFYHEIRHTVNSIEMASDLLGISRQFAIKPTQIFHPVASEQSEWDMIGRPMMHQFGERHTTGDANYLDDLSCADVAYCASVLSERSHARIVSVDASAALHLPGVLTYVDINDIPPNGTNRPSQPLPIDDDSAIFADGKVTTVGQTIGTIVAETVEVARRAVQLVNVQYDDLPAILNLEDAIAAQSFLMEPTVFERGDVAAALSASERVLEGEVEVGGQHHTYLETQSALVEPGEGGEWRVTASSQSLKQVQAESARILGCQEHAVTARTKRLGGAFGGKETHAGRAFWPALIAAHKLRRPVKYVQSRREDFLNTGGRHPVLAKYKIGFTAEGKLQSVDIQNYVMGGNFVDVTVMVMWFTLHALDLQYALPASARVRGWACRTNTPSNTAFRGFGAPQGGFVMETIMDRIAESIGKQPEEVRQVNLQYRGYRRATTEHVVDETSQLSRCWDECKRMAHFDERLADVNRHNESHKYVKRGVAMVPVHWGMGWGLRDYEQGAALVHVYTDGSVLVSHGGVEMGQGLNSKVLQVAGRVLRLPLDRITIVEAATDKVPNAIPTIGSMSADIFCPAVKDACEKLMQRIEPFMREKPDDCWNEWVKAAHTNRVSLSATGFAMPPRAESNATGARYYMSGAACAQVEIDSLTGAHQVLSADIVMDVGMSMNPAIDIGQIEGAFVQGQGLFTTEEIVLSPKTGQIKTDSLGAYKIPTAATIPRQFRVSLLKESAADNIYSSKGVGEPPLALSSSVYFAIAAAIRAFRTERRLPMIALKSPLTAERIRLACEDSFTKLPEK